MFKFCYLIIVSLWYALSVQAGFQIFTWPSKRKGDKKLLLTTADLGSLGNRDHKGIRL